MFIHIEHIDQVLPSIQGRSDFIHVKKEGYSVIDYVYTDKDSFDDPIRMECRGIKFDEWGRIIARPFEKFFNIGEKEQLHEIDFTQPHAVLEKLDGSMIHPAIVRGQLLFMTRMGHTDHAKMAQSRHNDARLIEGLTDLLTLGMTPIFEWTAPDNRIVVKYPESQLTLLAMRLTHTGEYADEVRLKLTAKMLGVPLVNYHGKVTEAKSFMESVRVLEGAEGYVVRFKSGKAYKVKAEDYLKKHRAVSDLDSEAKVLELVLSNVYDDLIPALDPEDADKLVEYASKVREELQNLFMDARNYAETFHRLGRKDFALGPAQGYDSRLRCALFDYLDGKDVMATVIKQVRKYPDLLKTRWVR